MRKTKPSSIVVQALLLTLLGGQARSLAQPHGPDEPRNDESTQRDDEGQPLPTDEGDVRNASPNRAWGHPRHLDPDRLGRRSYPRTYDGQRRYYYDDYTSRFGVPYRDDPYSDDLERAYRQGVEDGRHSERFDIQAERGFTSYQRAMAEGNTAFLSGRYGDAARAFLLAA